jgi:PHP family Zn ribbon phosphoesterase
VNHLLVAPHFQGADRIIDVLEHEGNLETEARPTVRMSAEALVAAVSKASPEALVIPAHAFGPQKSLFSASWGFDKIEDAYGAEAGKVRLLETGHSADPAMIRRCSALDGRALVSSSDAHHPYHIGREANCLDTALDYREIAEALVSNDRKRFPATIEMYPQEDRQHAAGCRPCRHRAAGGETVCPSCGKTLSTGVSDRVAALADRSAAEGARRAERHHKLISLADLIAQARGVQPDAESVEKDLVKILSSTGPELDILLLWEESALREKLPSRLADAVLAARRGEVAAEPGFDGLPGRVKVLLPAAPPETKTA